jgi:hypothetical protein
MAEFAPDVYRHCCSLLLRCAELDTNAALHAVFVTA